MTPGFLAWATGKIRVAMSRDELTTDEHAGVRVESVSSSVWEIFGMPSADGKQAVAG